MASTSTASTSPGTAPRSAAATTRRESGQLPRQAHHPPQHVLRIDPGADRGVVKGDRLVEGRRRGRLVSVLLAPPGFLVRVLVAEEVAGVHGQAATPEAAIERPSLSIASTSAGERAST